MKGTNSMTHILVDDNDEPIGMIDVDTITGIGTKLAFQFAANCGNPAELERLGEEALTKAGPDAFGYICANALRTLAEHILDPALTAGEAAGVYLRDGLTALAEGRQP